MVTRHSDMFIAKYQTKRGELWQLGRHRVMCGDATIGADVQRLFGGVSVDCVLTDPPYCSGGYQDSKRKRNSSKGTKAKEISMVNDMLSSRGYQALVRQVLSEASSATMVYLFTDWKMWVYLFDVAETCGYGVRGMIVWDKLFPGMGIGWRSQHELVLCGTKKPAMWAAHKKAGRGNVIQCKRIKNTLHPTQKPIEIICEIVKTTPFVQAIYDPFTGSGTTVLAAEKMARTCFAMEVVPGYVDVAVHRWELETGLTARRLP